MRTKQFRHLWDTRLHGPAWLGGTAQLFIGATALQSEQPATWPWALLLIAAISLTAWVANYRRYRQIHDLPTSRVASAPQGYVELFGRCEPIGDTTLVSRFTRTPCCWHAWRMRRYDSRGRWMTVNRGREDVPFLLIDTSGQCVVAPAGAEVLPGFGRTWRDGDDEFTEWILRNGAMLYAIGAFDTARGDVATADDERAAVAALLAEWKRDPVLLRSRFDSDGDGEIDLREWEEARLAAQREIRERRVNTTADTRPVHTLSRPDDDRLFLIANALPEQIAARFRYWSWTHLTLCIISTSAAVTLL